MAAFMPPMDPREAMALEEMAATRVDPRAALTFAGAFLLLLVIVFSLQVGAEMRDGTGPLTRLAGAAAGVRTAFSQAHRDRTWPSAALAANREALARIDVFNDAIEEETWISTRLQGPVQLILTRAFGVGNQQTHIGRDGWLFYQPDIAYATGPGFLERRHLASVNRIGATSAERQPNPLSAITGFNAALRARGIALVVLPAPGKATVHPEHMSARFTGTGPPAENPSYPDFVRALEREGVIVLDASREIAAMPHGDGGRYLMTDTHWRPEVVEYIAGRLADLLVAQAGVARAPSTYRVEPASMANVGDLALLLNLPARGSPFPPEHASMRRVIGENGSPWRPDRAAEVLILGDSFTNIYAQASLGWGTAAGLAEHLSAALGRPVDRIVQNDQGAYATREILARQIAERPDRLDGVRVVVYQFATRELMVGDWRIVDLSN